MASSIYLDAAKELWPEEEERGPDPLIPALELGTRKDPDRAAEAARIGRVLGVPPETVERNAEEAKRQERLRQLDPTALWRKAPVTAQHLADPAWAAQAHDDVENLTRLEEVVRGQKPKLSVGRVAGAVGAELSQVGPSKAAAELASLETDYDLDTPEGFRRFQKDLHSFRYARYRPKYEARYKELLAAGEPPEAAALVASREILEARTRHVRNIAERQMPAEYAQSSGYIESLARGIAGSAPDMALTALNPFAGMAGMTQTIYGAKYRQLRDDGVEAEQARRGAVISAAGQAPLEFAGNLISLNVLGKMVRGAAAKEVLVSFAESIAGNAAEEWLQTFPDVFGEIVAKNPDATGPELTSMILESIPATAGSREAWESALIGAGMGAFFPGVGLGVRGTVRGAAAVAEHAQRVGRTREQTAILQEAAGIAAESKLKARNPEAFQRLVKALSKGTKAENVYIDPKVLGDTLEQAGLDLDELTQGLPALKEDLEEALAKGTDVVIPMDDYLGKVAGTQAGDALFLHLRLAHDALSYAELEALQPKLAELAKAHRESLDAEVRTDAVGTIAEDLGKMLAKDGQPDPGGRAQTAAAIITNLATAGGVDPVAYYKKWKLQVVRELPEPLQGKGVDELTLLLERARKVAAGEQVAPTGLGPSLAEFLRAKGGLSDPGGELRAMDAMKSRPGLVSLVGMDPDTAAGAAFEAGYFPEAQERPAPDALLEALRAELAGTPRHTVQDVERIAAYRADAEALLDVLDTLGLDAKTATDAEVRAALEGVAAEKGDPTLPPEAPGSVQHQRNQTPIGELEVKPEVSNVVGWTPERVNLEIRKAARIDGKTKAAVAWVNPMSYVRATVPSDEIQRQIEKETGPLDLETLRGNDQTPFLYVGLVPRYSKESKQAWERMKSEGASYFPDDLEVIDFRITGHEGRHRMVALARAGVTRVPVVIDYGKAEERAPEERKFAANQHQYYLSGAMLSNIIPLTYENEARINQEMAGEGEPRTLFQLDPEKWDYPAGLDIFGTVNNRLSKELEVLERLLGPLATAAQLPGKMDERGVRQPTRTIRARDLGQALFDAKADGRLQRLVDPAVAPETLADERGLTGKERKAFLEEVKELRSGSLYGEFDAKGKPILSTNGKATASVDLILGLCQPTTPCQECYAAASMIRMSAVRKAMRTTIHLILDPQGFGEKVAAEAARYEKTQLPFIRLLGSGDLTADETVEAFNSLAQHADRPIHIFSRHHDNLAKLQGTQAAPFYKMGSVDAQLFAHYGVDFLAENLEKRGINNAWLYTDPSELPAVQQLLERDALGLILSAGHDLHESLPEAERASSCPCDAGERSYLGSCRQCALANAGCFMAWTDKAVDARGHLWDIQAVDKPKKGLTPALNFLAGVETKRGHDAVARSYAMILNDIVKKSKELIQLYLRGFEEGEKVAVTLKDLRWPDDTLTLIDRDAYIAREEAKGKKVDRKSLKDTESTKYMTREQVLDSIAAEIERLNGIRKKATKTGTFYLPGGEIQPPVAYKDWKRVRNARILKKQEATRLYQEAATILRQGDLQTEKDAAVAGSITPRGPRPDAASREGSVQRAPEPVKTDTPEFRRWFGDSKVVDKDGEPRMVVHATQVGGAEFDAFRPGRGAKGTIAGTLRAQGSVHTGGMWFGYPGTEMTNAYSGVFDETGDIPEGGAQYPVYLSIQNPKRMSNRDALYVSVEELEAQGYDGAYMVDSGDWVAFRPEQIKSVFNRGTFDPSDPRILYQGGETRAAADIQGEYDRLRAELQRLLDEGRGSAEEMKRVLAEYRKGPWNQEFYQPALEVRGFVAGQRLRDYWRRRFVGPQGDLEGDFADLEETGDLEPDEGAAGRKEALVEVFDWTGPGEVFAQLGKGLVEVQGEPARLEAARGSGRWTEENLRVFEQEIADRRAGILEEARNTLLGRGDLPTTAIATEEQVAALSDNDIEELLVDAARTEEARIGAARARQALYQKQSGPRASISFLPDRTVLKLFETADLSSFFHETGHLYLRMLQDLATMPGAAPGLTKDWATVLEYLGSKDGTLTREQEEVFARSYEAYLYEGKVPSVELRGIFQRFTAWLITVYKHISALNVTLTDEVRGVFDRMVASEEEIAAVEAANQMGPFVGLASDMTGAELADYYATHQEAHDAGVELLLREKLRGMKQAETLAYREDKKKVQARVERLVANRKVYQAIEWLSKGKWIGDDLPPDVFGPAMKLDSAAVEREFGAEVFGHLQKVAVPPVHKKGGMHPDLVAERLGYESGRALILDMINAAPRSQVVRSEVAAEMARLYPDRANSLKEKIDAALEAVHNDSRAKALAADLARLRKKAGQDPLPVRVVKAAAEKSARERKRVREAIQVGVYQRAQLLATQRAQKAYLEGNFVEAAEQQRLVLLNHYAAREAVKAKEEVRKIDGRLKAAAKNAKGKIHEQWWDQLEALLARYGYATVERDPAAKPVPPLAEFLRDQTRLASMEEDQEDVVNALLGGPLFDPFILDGNHRSEMRDLTLEQLAALDDAVKFLRGMGKEQTLLTEPGVSLELGVLERMKPLKALPKLKQHKESTWARQFFASVSILGFAWDKADGFKALGRRGKGDLSGPHRRMHNALARARSEQDAMLKEVRLAIQAPLSTLEAAIRRMPRQLLLDLPLPEAFDGTAEEYWTGERVLAAALNMGNADNLGRLLSGLTYADDAGQTVAYTEEQAKRIQGLLTADEWRAVQLVWDAIETLWPRLADMHEKVYHFRPKKIAATPLTVETADGQRVTLPGGYYPVRYDTKSHKKTAGREETKNLLQGTQAAFGAPAPERGFTKARTDKPVGYPLLLSLSVLSDHITYATTFATHAAVLKDAYRIHNHKDYYAAFIRAFGVSEWRALNGALKYIANPRSTVPSNVFEKMTSAVRAMSTAYILGINLSVAAKQWFSTPSFWNDVGFRRWWQDGVVAVTKDPVGCYRALVEASPYMESRLREYGREILQNTDRLRKGGKVRQNAAKVQDLAFAFIRAVDFMAVFPAWHAAYQKALAAGKAHEDAVLEADEMIRASQPSGKPMDLSIAQREKGVLMLVNQFLTYTLKFNNRARYFWRGMRVGAISKADYAWFVALEAVAPVIGMNLLFAALHGDLDDDEWLSGMPARVVGDVIKLFAGGLPVVRDLTNYTVDLFSGRKQYGREPLSAPLASISSEVGKGLKRIATAVENGEDVPEEAILALAEWVSIYYKIPLPKALRRVRKGLEQWKEEGGTPWNMLIPDAD